MARSQPAHQIAYTRLRDMVLFGHLAPGDAVTIEGLVERLDLGMTPVREALRRLIAEGALTLQGNRRVSVPRLDPQALADLGFARSICGEAALYFKPMDARAAADQIERLLEDQNLRADLIEKGYRQVQTFDTPRQRAEKYLEHCERLALVRRS